MSGRRLGSQQFCFGFANRDNLSCDQFNQSGSATGEIDRAVLFADDGKIVIGKYEKAEAAAL